MPMNIYVSKVDTEKKRKKKKKNRRRFLNNKGRGVDNKPKIQKKNEKLLSKTEQKKVEKTIVL
jgi:hypothetical protein